MEESKNQQSIYSQGKQHSTMHNTNPLFPLVLPLSTLVHINMGIHISLCTLMDLETLKQVWDVQHGLAQPKFRIISNIKWGQAKILHFCSIRRLNESYIVSFQNKMVVDLVVSKQVIEQIWVYPRRTKSDPNKSSLCHSVPQVGIDQVFCSSGQSHLNNRIVGWQIWIVPFTS